MPSEPWAPVSDEPCNRCLMHMNATLGVSAADGDKDLGAPASHSPYGLRAWYLARMLESGGDAVFTTGPEVRTFVPLSTWHGDPVCEAHLRELRFREVHGHVPHS